MGLLPLLVFLVVLCFLQFGGQGFGATITSTSPNPNPNPNNVTEWSSKRPGFLYTRTSGRCTPQFWSSGREAWPHMIPQESSVAKVFGSRVLERFEPGLTMWEAAQRNDDIGGTVFSKLVKQSSVALLNSYTRREYPYRAWEVKTLLLEALVSEDAAETQAKRFEQANLACK